MKLKLPKRRVWRVAIYLLSLLLVLVAIDLILIQLGRRIPVGYDTTRITAPTLPDGSVDYLAALENRYSDDVTTDNNAVPLLLQALGREALAKNQPRDGITTRLGISPLADTGDYFIHRDKFSEAPTTQAYNGANDGDPLPMKPWKAADRPQVAAWLNANEKPLVKVIEASKRPRFYYPFNAGSRPETLIEVALPYLVMIRESGRALTARGLLRISEGDIRGAQGDFLAAHRLARLLTTGATMIDRLVGYAMDGMTGRAEQAVVMANVLSADQLREWQKSLRDLPPLGGFAENFDIAERYMFLDIMQYSARRGNADLIRIVGGIDQAVVPSVMWNAMPFRYAATMRRGNIWYDELVAAAKKPSRAERNSALKAIDSSTASAKNASFFSVEWPLKSFFPGLVAIADKLDAADVQRSLTDVSIALALYRVERNAYPENLDALKPKFLADLPVDPFSEKPLVYRLLKQDYLLYSIGPDRADDGGKPVGTGPKGDLVAGTP